MSSEDRVRKLVTRIAILLAVLVVLSFLPFLLNWFPRRDDSRFPRSERDTVYILVEDHNYIARDRDKDGNVDCFLPVGTASVSGAGVYQAASYSGRCSKLGSAEHRLEPSLRHALSRIASLKFALDSSHASTIDANNDGSVDCVVSVHNPAYVLLQVAEGSCSSSGQGTMSAEQRSQYAEVFALEELVRGKVAGGPS